MEREEAIEVVRKNWPQGRKMLSEALQTLIPELAESEDERIRKDIERVIGWLKANPKLSSQYYVDRYDSMLAWLEKQKECSFGNFPKSCGDCPKEIQAAIDKEFGIDGRDDNDNPLNGYGDWKEGMVLNGPAIWGLVKLGIELQKEQKPFDIPSGGSGVPGTTPPSYKLDVKPDGWSEHDLTMIDNVLGTYKTLEDTLNLSTGQDRDILESMNFERDWLKSLPERVCLKSEQEWSREDERMVQCIIGDIKNVRKRLSVPSLIKMCDKEIAWLKSLRPQPHWKPSEEQMEALCYVKQFDYGGHKVALESLYNDLKKLM